MFQLLSVLLWLLQLSGFALGVFGALFNLNATIIGFFIKHIMEQKYFCSPFKIRSLSSFLVLEHSKCSKQEHFEQTPTAILLFMFIPLNLHVLATHFTLEAGALDNLPLPFLASTFSTSSLTISIEGEIRVAAHQEDPQPLEQVLGLLTRLLACVAGQQLCKPGDHTGSVPATPSTSTAP